MKYARNIALGILGGMLLFISLSLAWYVPLFGAERFSLALHLCTLFSCLFAFFSIAYKYTSICYSALRTVIMFISCICIFLLYVQMGVNVYVDELLSVSENLESGLLVAFVLYFAVIVSILANVIMPIWKFIRSKKRKSSKQCTEMDNVEIGDSIEFMPYGALKHLAIGFYIGAITLLVCVLQPWSSGLDKLFLLVFILVALFLAWNMSRQARLCVLADREGIALHNSVTGEMFRAGWNDFSAAYIWSDVKGHSYIILAVDPLDENGRKRVINSVFSLNKGNPRLSSVDRDVCIRTDEYTEEIVSIAGGKIVFEKV